MLTRREFLAGLEAALRDSVPSPVIQEQLYYYDHYITEQMAAGRSESEVIGELGDPRLLARTIEEATEGIAPGEYTEADYRETAGSERQRFAGARGSADTAAQPDGADSGADTQGGAYGSTGGRAQDSAYSGSDSGSVRSQGGAYGHSGSTGGRSGRYREEVFEEDGAESDGRFGGNYHVERGWGCLVFVLVLICVIWLIATLIGGIFALLRPVLAPLLVIWLIYWLLKRGRRN